jgi:preprotein translocase subunit SecA
MVNRAIGQAQGKVEGMNFDARKHLLDYDDVLNKQRLAIYRKRQDILATGLISNSGQPERNVSHPEAQPKDPEILRSAQNDKKGEMILSSARKALVLQMLDFLWMSHLENMEALQESVRLRAYGQHDPLVEYRREGHIMYQEMMANFEQWVKENAERIQQTVYNQKSATNLNQPAVVSRQSFVAGQKKVGRNDPCPCGSGKKYKRCHGA